MRDSGHPRAVVGLFNEFERGARASGTPFISFFTPAEITAFARETGFRTADHVSVEALVERYFARRTDGLRPPRNAEEHVIAAT